MARIYGHQGKIVIVPPPLDKIKSEAEIKRDAFEKLKNESWLANHMANAGFTEREILIVIFILFFLFLVLLNKYIYSLFIFTLLGIAMIVICFIMGFIYWLYYKRVKANA